MKQDLNITPVNIETVTDESGISFFLTQELGGQMNYVAIDTIHVWLMARACGVLPTKTQASNAGPGA